MTKNEFDAVKRVLEEACYAAYLEGFADGAMPFKDMREQEFFKVDAGSELLLRRELNRK